MTRKLNVAIVSILVVMLVAIFSPGFTAHANSAPTFWQGQDVFGAYVTDENCPVVVEGEKLTLNIPNFPGNYYRTLEELESYNASVTAEYTFHNPADYNVEMTLAFPFGKNPYSYFVYYDAERGEYVDYDDTARYKITADSEEIERNIRYTLDSWYFDPAVDIARLSYEKRTCGFITPETPVTAYTYELYPDQSKVVSCVAANFYGLGDADSTLILLDGFSMADYGKNKELCGSWLTTDHLLTMYVIGEPLKKMPEWKFYVNGGMDKEVAGEVKLSTKLPPTTVTFNEFALTCFDEEGDVGEVDWYNAVLDRLTGYSQENRLVLRGNYNSLNVSNKLLRWYEYELSIPSGGRVVNSVTAPLYPDIDLGWEPAIYSYTYLLSPASTWADFGSFEVEIKTPFCVVESSLTFEKGEEVYTYSQQGLPNGELTFTLSTSESPNRIRQPIGKTLGYFMLYYGIPVIFALVAVGIIVAVVLIIIKTVKKKKTKR